MKGGGTVGKRMKGILSVVLTGALAVAFVLAPAGLGGGTGGPGAGVVRAHGVAEQMLTPWDGFSAVAGNGDTVVINPATLADTKEHELRIEAARPLEGSEPDGMLYVYHEPDDGLGAGQLGYVTLTEGPTKVNRFVYSGSRDMGSAASVGFGLTHTRQDGQTASDSFATWGLDVGFRGVLFERLSVGAVVRNALLVGDDAARDELPPSLAAGIAFDVGPVTFAGDWLLQGREAPFIQGYAFGLEALLSRILLRYGERHFPDLASRYTYYGLGYRFDSGRVDVTMGERSGNRLLTLGLSLYF